MELVPYLSLATIVFFINCFPAFMPPTWSILAFFYITYHLPVIPLILIGVLFATLGRIVLYYIARYLGKYIFPATSKENLEFLGKYLNTKKHISIPFFLTCAFIPLPSNQLFITAGLAKANILLLAISFAFGRLFSYSWTVLTSAFVINNTSFEFSFAPQINFLIQIGALASVYLIGFIPWKKILKGRL